ncbi:MAG: flagellar motor switch protein FliM [Thermodesulfobacteriota bacterium]
MTDKVLSQDEVDALLGGVSDGDIETETGVGEESQDGYVKFDFVGQDRIVRARLPTYEMIHERFIRQLRNSFIDFLNRPVDITFDGIKMMKYGEFIKNVPLPASFNIYETPPLKGSSLIVFEARLIFQFIEYLFGGGNCGHARIEGRDFTEIEQRLIKKIVNKCFEIMEESWSSVHPLKLVLQRFEMMPQFVNLAVPTEVVVVSTVKVEVGGVTNSIFFCVPYSTLEPVREKLESGYQKDVPKGDNRWGKTLLDQIRDTSLNVTGAMGSGRLTIKDVMNLKVGDVIQLDKKVSDELEVKVEGFVKFLAKHGLHDGNYAMQVSSIKKSAGGSDYVE